MNSINITVGKNNISPQLKKYVGTNMGDSTVMKDSMTMVKNIEGRYTDGKMGDMNLKHYFSFNKSRSCC